MNARKKILVIIKSPSLNRIFCESLEKEGFEVYSFFPDKPILYRISPFDKCINIFQRFFFNNKNFLTQREEKKKQRKYITIAKELDFFFDYALFFRGDLFSEKMIKIVRSKTRKMISYQCDGISVSKNIIKLKNYFDNVFVFDPSDIINYKDLGFKPLTNCWFPNGRNAIKNERDFFYVGVGTPERKHKAKLLATFLDKRGFKFKFFLTIPKHHKEAKHNGIHLTHDGISYYENLTFVKSSKVLVDMKLPYHDGLSFRFFEAMNYEKKIITNNASVMDYDFYHPNNIFICDFNDFMGLEDFINKPYQKLDENVKNKYGFPNWIKYVLES